MVLPVVVGVEAEKESTELPNVVGVAAVRRVGDVVILEMVSARV